MCLDFITLCNDECLRPLEVPYDNCLCDRDLGHFKIKSCVIELLLWDSGQRSPPSCVALLYESKAVDLFLLENDTTALHLHSDLGEVAALLRNRLSYQALKLILCLCDSNYRESFESQVRPTLEPHENQALRFLSREAGMGNRLGASFTVQHS